VNRLINIASLESGSYSPMSSADANVFVEDDNIIIQIRDGSRFIISSQGDICGILNSVLGKGDNIAHIMYEPGRIYPQVSWSQFDSCIVRLGDIHHLGNPLTRAFIFLSDNNLSHIFLNTTPHWAPLFRSLGFSVAFWNKLSESARISHKTLIYDSSLKQSTKLKIGYIGSTNSKMHPRRSWFVNQLLSRCVDFSLHCYSSSHLEWFKNLSNLHYVIVPTLNGQFSHNIYTPGFTGCVMLTDQVNEPSSLLSQGYPLIQFESPNALTSFLANSSHFLMRQWMSYFVESSVDVRRLLLSMDHDEGVFDCANWFESDFLPSPWSCDTLKAKLFSSLAKMNLSILIFLNLLELLQEFHRVSKGKLIFTTKCPHLYDLLVEVACLSRFEFIFLGNPLNSSAQLGSFDFAESLITAKVHKQGCDSFSLGIFMCTQTDERFNFSDYNYCDNSILDFFSDFSSYSSWPQLVNPCIKLKLLYS